jgi:hypothetical protein
MTARGANDAGLPPIKTTRRRLLGSAATVTGGVLTLPWLLGLSSCAPPPQQPWADETWWSDGTGWIE